MNAKTFSSFAGKLFRKDQLTEDCAGDMNDTTFRIVYELLMNSSHPNLVPLVHVFEDEQLYYVVMKKCGSLSLYDTIRSAGKEGTRIPEEQIKPMMFQLLNAVGYLHQLRLLHRDIKPDNVLYAADDGDQLMLADFDMCHTLEEDSDTFAAEAILGTPGFLAPEILSDAQYGLQSDLFAIGCLFYSLATAELPVDSKGDVKKFQTTDGVLEWIEDVSSVLELESGDSFYAQYSVEMRKALRSMIAIDLAERPKDVESFVASEWVNGGERKRGSKRPSKKKRSVIDQLLLSSQD